MYSEKQSKNDLDDRLFLVSQIKSGSVEKVSKALQAFEKPKKPLWVPRGNWTNDNTDAVISSVLKSKRSTGLMIKSSDMLSFSDCLNVERDIRKFLSWFEYKGSSAGELAKT